MKYKGIELIEMLPENWDGKTREMLVWDDTSKNPYKKIIIGYFPGCFPQSSYWKSTDDCSWRHCAEIPTEEIVTEYSLNDCINSLKEHFKSKNEDSPDDEIAFPSLKESYKSIIKYLDELKLLKEGRVEATPFEDVLLAIIKVLKAENKELKEKIKSENKPKKKLRRMTYKELSEWLAKGNGQYKDGNFGSFRTELVYCKNEENTIVDNDCLIRGFNEDTWHEPLIEE